MTVSPLIVHLLLHFWHSPDEPIAHASSEAVQEGVKWLHSEGLTRPVSQAVSGYLLSLRGRQWLDAILDTPLPAYKYPRFAQWFYERNGLSFTLAAPATVGDEIETYVSEAVSFHLGPTPEAHPVRGE